MSPADKTFQHYLIEKRLSNRLRVADRTTRLTLYANVYNELFRQVPWHPQLTPNPATRKTEVDWLMGMLIDATDKRIDYMEIGVGDCALFSQIAALCRHGFGIDVSEEIVKEAVFPDNAEIRLSNGVDIPVPPESVDFAFSHHIMEHLHVDDALEQLQGIFTSLRSGGSYMCSTPHRFTGPHDISRGYDTVATGLHLHEYTVRELRNLFLHAGFRRIFCVGYGRGQKRVLPASLVILAETVIGWLPHALRRRLSESLLLRPFFDRLVVLGIK